MEKLGRVSAAQLLHALAGDDNAQAWAVAAQVVAAVAAFSFGEQSKALDFERHVAEVIVKRPQCPLR